MDDWLTKTGETEIIIIGVALAVLFGVFVIWYEWQSREKRARTIRELAERLGFSFTAGSSKLDGAIQELDFYLFSLGRIEVFDLFYLGIQVDNLVEGTSGEVDIAIFDYAYGGKRPVIQTVIMLRSPGRILPAFDLRPKTVWHKAGVALGYQDIAIDSSPEFSGAYLLRGTQVAAIRDLFTPEFVSRFLDFSKYEKWSIETRKDFMIFYKLGKKIEGTTIPEFLKEVLSMAKLFWDSPSSNAGTPEP